MISIFIGQFIFLILIQKNELVRGAPSSGEGGGINSTLDYLYQMTTTTTSTTTTTTTTTTEKRGGEFFIIKSTLLLC